MKIRSKSIEEMKEENEMFVCFMFKWNGKSFKIGCLKFYIKDFIFS